MGIPLVWYWPMKRAFEAGRLTCTGAMATTATTAASATGAHPLRSPRARPRRKPRPMPRKLLSRTKFEKNDR